MELFAGLIADEPEQTQQWVSNLRAGIRLLSGTVNNVLSLYSGSNPHIAAIDLTACMKSAVEFVQPIAEQAGVALSFMGANECLTIQGNENGLRQIVLNLACNAIRHTPAGGTITVSTQAITQTGAARAVVEIADTGCGIAPQLMEKLFEPGISADGNTPGLGLAVCKRLMLQHGGEIHVSSRVNRGTTFRLEFPTL
jgi:two-component system sensor histidine kinase FlrB